MRSSVAPSSRSSSPGMRLRARDPMSDEIPKGRGPQSVGQVCCAAGYVAASSIALTNSLFSWSSGSRKPDRRNISRRDQYDLRKAIRLSSSFHVPPESVSSTSQSAIASAFIFRLISA